MRAKYSRVCRRTFVILCGIAVTAFFAGCENSCLLFVSNPGGTLPPPTLTCSVAKPAANVNLAIHSGATLQNVVGSDAAQHIFVTIRGVQAHADERASGDSPDWTELAPELATQPVQVDLLRPAGNSCATGPLGDHIVVAGVYRKIRLQLASSAAFAIAPRDNACGNIGLHCIVSAAGAVRALAFETDPPVIHLASDRISGGFVRILPDSHVTLALEFNPFASTLRPTAEAARLTPLFTLAVRPSCDTPTP